LKGVHTFQTDSPSPCISHDLTCTSTDLTCTSPDLTCASPDLPTISPEQVDQPAIAAAVTAACEQGTLQSSRATLPQGGGLPLATGDAVTPLLETPPAGEAGERRKGSASWWARPSIDSVALCRAMSPCIEDWAAGESDPTAPPL